MLMVSGISFLMSIAFYFRVTSSIPFSVLELHYSYSHWIPTENMNRE